MSFMVTEADADAIRAAYERGGELSAVVELRRLFPGLANNENTRACALSIASWTAEAGAKAQGNAATAQRAIRARWPN
jgi:hypothetical protein